MALTLGGLRKAFTCVLSEGVLLWGGVTRDCNDKGSPWPSAVVRHSIDYCGTDCRRLGESWLVPALIEWVRVAETLGLTGSVLANCLIPSLLDWSPAQTVRVGLQARLALGTLIVFVVRSCNTPQSYWCYVHGVFVVRPVMQYTPVILVLCAWCVCSPPGHAIHPSRSPVMCAWLYCMAQCFCKSYRFCWRCNELCVVSDVWRL